MIRPMTLGVGDLGSRFRSIFLFLYVAFVFDRNCVVRFIVSMLGHGGRWKISISDVVRVEVLRQA